MEVISIKALSKSYKIYNKKSDRIKEIFVPQKTYSKSFNALKNLNLEISKGEIVGIIGRNGAGKSTLLKLITGIIQPTKGSLDITGKVSAILELTAGFNQEFTGRENIKFFCDINEIPESRAKELEKEIIEFSELGDFIDQPLKNYSSGMRSKFAFSVNTNVNPDILILDEVLSVGDEVFKRKSFMKMQSLLQSGKTVLFVTHNLKSVREICSRAIILDKGEIIFDGSSMEAVTNYQLLVNSPTPAVYTQIREKIINKDLEDFIDYNSKFDPNFTSKAKQVQKYFDVDITEIKVTDTNGEEQNILETGNEYILEYKIKTNINLIEISTRFNFKTESNIPFAAAYSKLLDSNSKVINLQEKDCCTIKWRFHCSMLSGKYYGNIAISSQIEGEEKILNRIVDAFAIKVETTKEISAIHRDIVSLNQQISVQK